VGGGVRALGLGGLFGVRGLDGVLVSKVTEGAVERPLVRHVKFGFTS
jgi:hypothetical protein